MDYQPAEIIIRILRNLSRVDLNRFAQSSRRNTKIVEKYFADNPMHRLISFTVESDDNNLTTIEKVVVDQKVVVKATNIANKKVIDELSRILRSPHIQIDSLLLKINHCHVLDNYTPIFPNICSKIENFSIVMSCMPSMPAFINFWNAFSASKIAPKYLEIDLCNSLRESDIGGVAWILCMHSDIFRHPFVSLKLRGGIMKTRELFAIATMLMHLEDHYEHCRRFNVHVSFAPFYHFLNLMIQMFMSVSKRGAPFMLSISNNFPKNHTSVAIKPASIFIYNAKSDETMKFQWNPNLFTFNVYRMHGNFESE